MTKNVESSIVIKVKFGDTLRRFNAPVVDNQKLGLDMEALSSKILKLFSLDPEADFMLTYTDCDGDVVTLVDDNDLNDVMMQRLNPFRIEVAQMEEGSVKSYSGSIGSSTPRRSPNFHGQLSVVNEEDSNKVQVTHTEPLPADSFSGEIADFFPQSEQSSNNQFSQVEKISSTGNRASVHAGIICDGCDAYPITGPRFKSKVKDYYDLRSTCFSKMCKEEEYVRIDHPFSFPSVSQKLLNDPVQRSRRCPLIAPLETLSVHPPPPPPPPKLDWDSHFVDVNVKDDTTIAPSTPFTKVWRVFNTGDLSWPQGTRVEWIGGDKLSVASAVELEVPWDDLPSGEEVDIEVDFTAPEKPGNYISLWRLVSPSGEFFGEKICVEIEVEGHQKNSPRQISRSSDLNLPPRGRKGLKDPAIIGSNIEKNSKPFGSKRSRKRVQATLGKKTSYDKKLSFKKNNATSNPAIPQSHEGTSLFGKTATFSPSTSSHESALGNLEDPQDLAIERMLMSDLEDLGFGQIDLNKKVLRKNDYDIDEAVKDLVAAVKWDPAIEELEKMGFLDLEMNKSMLLKHDGCLWSALMDLIDAYGVTDCDLWGDE